MSDFDYEIWSNKAVKKLIFGILVGALTEISAFLGAEPIPKNYVWTTVFAIEGIELIINFIKHKYLK